MKTTWKTGRIVGNRYRLVSRLGQGGMGEVWRAEHMTLRSPVAVKFIDPSIAESEEAVARFVREAQSAAALRSTHIVQILDHGVDGNVQYIAMELLEGESLGDRLEREKTLSFSETAQVLNHVSRAVGRAHENGIIHRDLKPDNIFLAQEDDEFVAKVLDFGIAKALGGKLISSADVSTQTGTLLGTPYYMSPEQIKGSKGIDWRSDLWAITVIVFECLTGKKVFEAETLAGLLVKICVNEPPIPSRITALPPIFDSWFSRGLHEDPERRFQSAKEMNDTFQALLSSYENNQNRGGTAIADTIAAQGTTGQNGSISRVVPTPSLPGTAFSRASGSDNINLESEMAIQPGPGYPIETPYHLEKPSQPPPAFPRLDHKIAAGVIGILVVVLGIGMILYNVNYKSATNEKSDFVPAKNIPAVSAQIQDDSTQGLAAPEDAINSKADATVESPEPLDKTAQEIPSGLSPPSGDERDLSPPAQDQASSDSKVQQNSSKAKTYRTKSRRKKKRTKPQDTRNTGEQKVPKAVSDTTENRETKEPKTPSPEDLFRDRH